MSLTSMLDDNTSPLRQLFAAELPDLPAVRAAYRATRPATWQVTLPQPPVGVRPAWGTLGAAIDHRLRFALSKIPIHEMGAIGLSVRMSGTSASGRPAPVARTLMTVGLELLEELQRFSRKHEPSDRSRPMQLPDDAERWLAKACYLASLYEEFYRTKQLWAGTPLGDARAGTTLNHLLDSVPPYAVADIMAMTNRAVTALSGLRSETTALNVVAGPTFAGSRDVGGADADWIAGGLLVDVKSTSNPQKLAGSDIHQLAGYVLLDYDNERQITEVGWYLARAGWLVTWEATEFFALLGARHTLAELRALTARVVAGS